MSVCVCVCWEVSKRSRLTFSTIKIQTVTNGWHTYSPAVAVYQRHQNQRPRKDDINCQRTDTGGGSRHSHENHWSVVPCASLQATKGS